MPKKYSDEYKKMIFEEINNYFNKVDFIDTVLSVVNPHKSDATHYIT